MKLVVAALLVRGDELLICQRSADGPMPLKWEFPGGKVEAGEEPAAALARELREELGIEASVGAQVARITHEYKNGFYVDLLFFRVNGYLGEIVNRVFAEVRWEKRTRLPEHDFLEADIKLVTQIAAGEIV